MIQMQQKERRKLPINCKRKAALFPLAGSNTSRGWEGHGKGGGCSFQHTGAQHPSRATTPDQRNRKINSEAQFTGSGNLRPVSSTFCTNHETWTYPPPCSRCCWPPLYTEYKRRPPRSGQGPDPSRINKANAFLWSPFVGLVGRVHRAPRCPRMSPGSPFLCPTCLTGLAWRLIS